MERRVGVGTETGKGEVPESKLTDIALGCMAMGRSHGRKLHSGK